jgi:ribosomal protein L3
MAGHMGVDTVTTRNHPLVASTPPTTSRLIKASLPGPNGRAPLRS